ncbi:hypothetical protein J2R99_002579 [Rhodopseudomonas julia]|uniref:Uncharacterized protein n=1 Tax=Rhodopseudomonas julia TaxID=200617 RepID=A0ABU0C888_9BRAD|nr:hypothetical protein [Rhodopseudomonas julia]MDQ0326710.1 hypothetical protein [Rhodopseudomonas julia]
MLMEPAHRRENEFGAKARSADLIERHLAVTMVTSSAATVIARERQHSPEREATDKHPSKSHRQSVESENIFTRSHDSNIRIYSMILS